MKILVTGATGLVGSALVAALARDGHMVCRLVRPQTKAEGGVAGTFDVAWNPETGELGGAAVGAEAVINLGAVVGLLPVSGITLPFLSAGGSSLVITMLGAGILANVARRTPSRSPSRSK